MSNTDPTKKGGGWIQVLQMQSFTDQCSGVYYPVRSKFIISRWTIKYIILPAERHRLVCISNLHTYIICSSVRYIFFKYYFSYLRSLSLRRFLIFWLGTLVYLLSMFFYLFNKSKFYLEKFLNFCVVILCVLKFWVPCCDINYDFRIKTMFGSYSPSPPPVVCKRSHVLSTLFVFICA